MSKINELKEIFNKYSLSDSDLEKLKERKYDEINEETKEVFAKIGIGEKEIEEMLRVQEEMDHHCYTDKSKEEEFTHCGQETPEEKIIPREEIKKFLQDRSMSRSFINTFLKIGFNEEFQRSARKRRKEKRNLDWT
ncbi:uncharacterized protein LOC133667255 [Apis cerana]|uniref:uncharacterized protein LOC133667255 n=1 Tax=Apis cerana TaxID=7461 RepID=UPI002B22FC33|nr:uncharacterized protein LOC133667255 [Apis cerana]